MTTTESLTSDISESLRRIAVAYERVAAANERYAEIMAILVVIQKEQLKIFRPPDVQGTAKLLPPNPEVTS